MFPGFNGVALNAQKPFFLIAFVMVVYHLVQRLSGPGSKESQLRAIGSAMVLAACIALSNSGAKLVQTGFTTIQTDMGAGNSAPDLVEAKKEELIVAMTVGVEEKAATAAGDTKGALYYLTHWGDAIDKGIESLVPSIGGLIIQVASFFLIFWAKLASLIAWGFWLIQQFLFTFSLIFLPAMIAMIGVGSLRSIGTRYVMSVVGLLSWPMGWGLVNVGTEAMLTSAVNTVKAAPAADWEITTYLWAIATVSIIPFWMIFGYAFVPFVIQRMVTSGANAASGLIGQTAGAAIGAGAAIATGGASLAAGAAAGAGGGGGTRLPAQHAGQLRQGRTAAHQRVIGARRAGPCGRDQGRQRHPGRPGQADNGLVGEQVEQERPHRRLIVGSAQVQQDNGDLTAHGCRLFSPVTISSTRSTWAIGVSGRMPWPRLKMNGPAPQDCRYSSTRASRASPPARSSRGSSAPWMGFSA